MTQREPQKGDALLHRANLLVIFDVNTRRNRIRAAAPQVEPAHALEAAKVRAIMRAVPPGEREAGAILPPLPYLRLTTGIESLQWCPREDVQPWALSEFVVLLSGAPNLKDVAKASEKRLREIVNANPQEEGFWIMPGMMLAKNARSVSIPIGKPSELRELLNDLYR